MADFELPAHASLHEDDFGVVGTSALLYFFSEDELLDEVFEDKFGLVLVGFVEGVAQNST